MLEHGVLPRRDMIVVRISGPVVDSRGGDWYGMSGSPVYVTHRGARKLLGGVAYGFTWGPTNIVGLTSGPDIVDLAAAQPAADYASDSCAIIEALVVRASVRCSRGSAST